MTMPENPEPVEPEAMETPQMTVRGRRRIESQEDSTRAAVADVVNKNLQTATPIAPQTRDAAPKRGRPVGAKDKAPRSPRTQTAAPSVSTLPKSETTRVVESAKARSSKRDTPNAPDFSEWSDFLGEVVLHWFSVAFVAVALRGVPYHEIFSP